jgi:hypothetical protein
VLIDKLMKLGKLILRKYFEQNYSVYKHGKELVLNEDRLNW